MRQLPGREGVGRETLMHQGQRRGRQVVAQIVVETADLGGEQQALVHNRPRRERRHIQFSHAGDVLFVRQRAEIVQDLLADRQDLALERVLVADRHVGGDDRHADHRHGLDHRFAEAREVGRHVAPADHGLAFLGHDLLEMLDDVVAGCFVARQEAHRHGVAPGGGQRDAVYPSPVVQQGVRHLDQDAGAVADQRISPDRAAVVQVLQDLQTLGDDVMRFSALDVHHEANAARVVLVLGIVKALSHNLLHCHNFPWRNISAVRVRAYAQETLLPIGWTNGNDPAAPQRRRKAA